MAIRSVRVQGDEILTKKARPVTNFDPMLHELLDDMLHTLRAKDAVGLAAPQVGILKRVVVVEFDEEYFELINPEIISTDGTQSCNEACLSVPGKCGDIDRPFEITVRALDRHGKEFTVTVDEFLASAFCHEIDHLEGILFSDTATNMQYITEDQAVERKKLRMNRRQRRLNKRG